METMIEERLESLDKLSLSGFVFKKWSPSCGVERVPVYTLNGMPSHSDSGIFALAFQNQFPLIPIEEEGRLYDPALRENFIERVFSVPQPWKRRWDSSLNREPLKSL
jgi:hypothetical protein